MQEIGNNAFKGCVSLSSFTLNKNVTTIGKAAFRGCKNLSSITVKTKELGKKSIGSQAFKGIHSGVTIKCPSSKLKNYKKYFKKAGAPSGAIYRK